MIYLGFDTSNYTTSVASCGDGYDTSIRRILEVKQGERGLRQSDAVFQHIKELPNLYYEMSGKVDFKKVCAVGVSTRPRSIEGSYMPVFLAGNSFARVCADTLGVPLYSFSHQDGHIMAGIYSIGAYELLDGPFISVHLSGGTTEILKSEYNGYNFDNEIIGGTLDISAGQLIDRTGVNMGLKFPCGKELEKLALSVEETFSLPVSVKGSYVNLSGIETKLQTITGFSDAVIARSVLFYIAEILKITIRNAVNETGIKKILVAGGVASNSIIRTKLIDEFSDNIYFASKELSSDNSVGTAVLTYKAEEKK